MCNAGAAVTVTVAVTGTDIFSETATPPELNKVTGTDTDESTIANDAIVPDDENVGVTLPSMVDEAGPDGQGLEIPLNQIERKRSEQKSEQGEVAFDVVQTPQRQRSGQRNENSEQRDVGLECKGIEHPRERVESKRSDERNEQKSDEKSDHLGHASTFDRPTVNYMPINSVNSMPCHTRSPKSKRPLTLKKIIPSQVLSLPNDSHTGDKDISKSKMKEAKELAKFAIKALDMKDTDIAVKRLKEALEALN